MFARILVPLDGSELAERSLDLAVQLASAGGGELILLRVPVAEQVLTAPYSQLDTYHLEMSTRRSASEAKRYLDEVENKYLEKGVKITKVVTSGQPSEVIRQVADEQNTDLILISSHGYSGIRKWVLGSVAEAVLQQAGCCPVLVLHSSKPLKNILITLDGSPLSEIALQPGLELVKLTGSKLILLRIQDHLDYIDDDALSEMETTGSGMTNLARRSVYTKVDPYLVQLEKRLQDDELELEVASFVSDDPAQGILDFAKNRNVDCIIMATHGRSGLSRLVYGSVSERVLSRFERSMLIVRPEKTAPEDT